MKYLSGQWMAGAVCGALATVLVVCLASKVTPGMAADKPAATPAPVAQNLGPVAATPAPADTGTQVLLDERDMKTDYANAYRIHTTTDEAIIDFGFNMPNPDAADGKNQLLLKMNDRVILNYKNAKRLSASLSKVISQYEAQVGPIAN